MEVYGLTGGIGSGKSTVAEMLEEYGIPVVSADELSRMVVAPGSDGLADVVREFGPEVLDDRGELDRKKMGRIVFATPERRQKLESILHPRIRERYEQVLDALEKAGHEVMVYEVPLLFEKKLDQQDEMRAVILVTASADTRIARVKQRDSLTTEDVLGRMRAQMPETEKRKRADYIIHNEGDLDDLRREVEYLLSRFLRLPPRADKTRELELELGAAQLDADELDADEVEPEELELDEAELELDEAELDTLAPAEVAHDDPTAEMELAAPAAQDSDDTKPLEVGLQRPNQPKADASSGTILEVQLEPARPGPVKVPSPKPAAAPQAAAPRPPQVGGGPAQASGGSPKPPRPRPHTIPQLSIPKVGKREDESSDEGEEPAT